MNIIATIRPWHIELYRRELPFWPGDWRLVTGPEELEALVRKTRPRYVFFPHWSWRVPEEMWRNVECICFHETPVPYGRGGTPIQNMIARGHTKTLITALRMTGEIDAGPVYLQRELSLAGRLAEEIYIRSAMIIIRMILDIVEWGMEPVRQRPRYGYEETKLWPRRRPCQSGISETDNAFDLLGLFDHIRMTDADEYPRAFLEYGGYRFEFSRPALRVGRIEADVRITKCPA